jgi:hypothetical protein
MKSRSQVIKYLKTLNRRKNYLGQKIERFDFSDRSENHIKAEYFAMLFAIETMIDHHQITVEDLEKGKVDDRQI